MARSKKKFAPTLRHYSNDLSKRWRIEYRKPSGQLVAIYGNINKYQTVEDRHQAAIARHFG